jgi:dolichol-phosphate mannosyltransferase
MKKENSKVTVIIPTFNEESMIKEMITKCKPFCNEIIVVNAKKSTDKTRDIAKKMGVKVIIDHGMGKGEGMRCGINEVQDGIIVFIDADGSHLPEDIPKLTKPIAEGKADMVIASRVQGGTYDDIKGHPWENFFRGVFTLGIALVINLRFKTDIVETQNGFRAVRTDVAKNLKLTSNHTEVETEMCIKCLKQKSKILEVPSPELPRRFGSSNIKLWKDGFKYMWIVLKNIF